MCCLFMEVRTIWKVTLVTEVKVAEVAVSSGYELAGAFEPRCYGGQSPSPGVVGHLVPVYIPT